MTCIFPSHTRHRLVDKHRPSPPSVAGLATPEGRIAGTPRCTRAAVVCAVAILSIAARAQTPLGDAFTYQGLLHQSGQPVTDACDLTFSLWNDPVSTDPADQIGPTLTFDGMGGNPPPINIVDGVFTVQLDFGPSAFDGNARWLQVDVGCPSGSPPTSLAPRQELTANPYALVSKIAADLTLPFVRVFSSGLDALSVTNNGGGRALHGASTSGDAIEGETATGTAVRGTSSSAGVGVSGTSSGALGTGVRGSGTGGGTGVGGESDSGTGVIGTTETGVAVRGVATDDGSAATFENNHGPSTADVVRIETTANGIGLVSRTTGTAGAAVLEINAATPATNPADALAATTNAAGRAARFEVTVSDPTDNMTDAVLVRTTGSGRAGLFEIDVPNPADNNQPVLEATTSGAGPGMKAFSPASDGVLGITNKTDTFVTAPDKVAAGVHGLAAPGSTADNFGIAGVATDYGTGVLGIGSTGGHGIVGVSARAEQVTRTLAGVWGMTREGLNGAMSWPPHFPLNATNAPKRMVGVLGQGYDLTGVWGESINGLGVVGTVGNETSFDDVFLGIARPIGVLGRSSISGGTAGYFENVNAANGFSALIATTAGTGSAAQFDILNPLSSDSAVSATSAGVGRAGSFYVPNVNDGPGDVVAAFAGGGISSPTSAFRAFFASQAKGRIPPAAPPGAGIPVVAGHFENVNPQNESPTVIISHAGSGPVLQMQRTAAGDMLQINTSGPIPAGSRIGDWNCQTNVAETSLSIFNAGQGQALLVSSVGTTGAPGVQFDAPSGIALNGPIVNTTLTTNRIDATDIEADTLSVSGSKNFRIDHPLAPETKYLQHACLESNEIKTLYDGIVVTDDTGYAEVVLPDWFQALNADFRYQLTVIGSFARAIISEEVHDNRFVIRTDEPLTRVSWQVTGIRHDAAARAFPLQVELDKPMNALPSDQYDSAATDHVKPGMANLAKSLDGCDAYPLRRSR